jgi:stage IV sporulation protein FB
MLFVGAVDVSNAIKIGDPSANLLERLAVVNIFLAAFNLIPAFPMDGGRVLRAALSIWLGKERATRIAALIGQGFAFVLGFLGLFGNPLLLFIAIFVYIAAAGEAQMTTMAEAARGLKAADAMETRIAVIDRGSSIREAVDILLATSQDEFPVVDASRRLSGFLSRSNIIEALRASDPGAPVAPFMRREIATIDVGDTIDAAMAKLTGGEAVGVTDAEGRLLGLLTRQSLAEIMMIKEVRPDWRFSPRDDSPYTVA